MAVISIKPQNNKQGKNIMQLVTDQAKVILVLAVLASFVVLSFLPHVSESVYVGLSLVLYYLFHDAKGDVPPTPPTLPSP